MNLSALRTKTRYFLDDDSATRWTDAEVDSYINEAYRFYYNKLVANNYDGVLKQASINLVSGQDQYSLPSDWFKTRILYKLESSANFEIPLQYKRNYDNWVDTTGWGSSFYTPAYDYVADTTGELKLVLYPEPSFSENNGLKLFYWPTVTELTLTTSSPVTGFNTQWHDLIPLRAAIWAKAGREEEDVTNLSGMLAQSETAFNETINRMSNARAYVEPFDIEEGY